ncbi:conserved hypothetical protein [Theileria equi strain WA]|uniref:Uncharacterized protein n=1 Tax=Theileria equi strain WA TaxID=1537102 RepID=L1LC56_THEEQ|nr:conserved hypothetical protein [Theileria equi strain WA]EKX72825.1 conserved hypothetical protein [Theileria equi strain WA]|eukprot:XP_004832277.1 conserved hypothetical protein [Theileria equi strain WA]
MKTGDFFQYPFDVQIVMGLTLIGVPNEWTQENLVCYVKSYCYAFGREEIGIIATWLDDDENVPEGKRKAHIACNCLYSKQRLLEIRIIPIILPSSAKYGEKECSVITIRPYCFWVKLSPQSEPIPYMFPKYGSSDVYSEKVETTLLLQDNNVQPTIVACLMECGILPRDGRPWDAATAYSLWLRAKNTPVGFAFESQLCKLHNALRVFKPHEYDVTDDLVYESDWRNVFFQDSWLWERMSRGVYPQSDNVSADLRAPSRNFSSKEMTHSGLETPSPLSPPFIETYKTDSAKPIPEIIRAKKDRRAGCIRYESNRNRWVVDLSIDGRRMQKCFHEGFFGIVGGMQEARKWRYDYLKQVRGYFVEKLELRIVEDLVDKIMQMDKSLHKPLIDALKTPIPEYEDACDINKVVEAIEARIKHITGENNG